MGITINSVKFLSEAKESGVNFGKTITIGRQSLFLSESDRLDLSKPGIPDITSSLESLFVEPLLMQLGASVCDSLDASDYEGATVIHDMNSPLPQRFHNKYHVVIDGGSLEHVFNFPVAIQNCMDLLEEGGHFIGFTPTNNFLGHGFYQFSPELFYRVFSTENGFHLVKMVFHIDHPKASWFEVRDPLDIKERVILSNSYPSYLMVLAKKVRSVQAFSKQPIQSDYINIRWNTEGDLSYGKMKPIKKQYKLKYFTRFLSLYYYKLRLLLYALNETGTGKPSHFSKVKINK